MPNYYEILDLPKTATTSDIKKKYRKLAVKYHPDKNKTQDTQETFKRITEAYKTLSDKEKRKRYDYMLDNKEFSDQDIDSEFGINLDTAMDFFNESFRHIFGMDPKTNKKNEPFSNDFFKKTNNNEDPFNKFDEIFNKNSFFTNNLKGNAFTKSYKSTYTTAGVKKPDGKYKGYTKKIVEVGSDGRKEKYSEEYFEDETGQKRYVTKDENPITLKRGNIRKNKRYRLLN